MDLRRFFWGLNSTADEIKSIPNPSQAACNSTEGRDVIKAQPCM